MREAPEPLVLLPGMNCSARLWSPVLASDRSGTRLQAAVREVVQPPLRGRSVEDCVDQLLARLPARFALAGLSLGAIVSLALVRRAPDRVSRLALLAVNARAPRADQQVAWTAQRRSLAAGDTPRMLQELLLPHLVVPRRRTPELDEAVLTMADETGPAALDDQLAVQQTRRDERPTLGRVAVPTLVLAGGADALVPVARNEEVCEAIPGARLEVLSGTGHLSTLEEPDAVADVLLAWSRS